MDTNGFNSFEDFVKFCRSTYENMGNNENSNDKSDSQHCNNCRFGSKNADADDSSRKANSDIPGGFQDINPQLFTIVTAIFGTVIAGNLPFNIQNAIGNWLELIGQSIITFNAQQQYFQGGPGRYYDPIYRNAANPFCSSNSDESQKGVTTNTSSEGNKDDKLENNKNDTINISVNELKELKKSIEKLNKEVKRLNREIEGLKK